MKNTPETAEECISTIRDLLRLMIDVCLAGKDLSMKRFVHDIEKTRAMCIGAREFRDQSVVFSAYSERIDAHISQMISGISRQFTLGSTEALITNRFVDTVTEMGKNRRKPSRRLRHEAELLLLIEEIGGGVLLIRIARVIKELVSLMPTLAESREAHVDENGRFERTFTPDSHSEQAFIGLLHYLSTVLKQKDPDCRYIVSIKQEGNQIHLIIEYPTASGKAFQNIMGEFQMVMSGRLSPEDFLPDPLHARMLQQKIELLKLELDQTRENLRLQVELHGNRISGFESMLEQFRGEVERLSLPKKSLNDIQFKVAFSYPSEHRSYVAEVAQILGDKLGRDSVFFDLNNKGDLARPNLDLLLQSVYRTNTDLVVVFLCSAYQRKKWCGLEWRAVRDIIISRNDDLVMFVRFDDDPVDGSFAIDGYLDARSLREREVAQCIADRVDQICQKRLVG